MASDFRLKEGLPQLTDQIELQLAGRFDNYSDVGSTANPKLSVTASSCMKSAKWWFTDMTVL